MPPRKISIHMSWCTCAMWFVAALPHASAQQSKDAAQKPADLLRQAIDSLAKHKTIQTAIHQRIELFGRSLTVTGKYVKGEVDMQTRLELNFDLAESLKGVAGDSYMLMVCDGTRLTLREAVLNSTQDVTINVRQLVDVLEEQEKLELKPVVIDLLGLGGIGQLLRGLNDTMDPQRWTRDEQTEKSYAEAGGAGVYVLRGKWKSQFLAAYQPAPNVQNGGNEQSRAAVPSHVPTHVVLVLDRASGIPHRIEYVHVDDKTNKESPIVRIECRDPKLDQAIDPTEFIMLETNPIDLTDDWVTRLRQPKFLEQLEDPARNKTSPLHLMVRELRPDQQQ